MTLSDIVALIASVTGHRAMEAPGGYLVCATPHVGEFSYLGRIYDPVPMLASEWAKLQQFGKHPYLTFLTEAANGLRYANISLYGVVAQIDRSIGPHVGHPISLDYGNVFGRPSGLSADSMVIGGIVGWSSKGHYVMDQTGAVSLVNCLDADDIVTDWPNLRAMLISEIGRVTELHDVNGQELVSATELMHPAGRVWETEDDLERLSTERFLMSAYPNLPVITPTSSPSR